MTQQKIAGISPTHSISDNAVTLGGQRTEYRLKNSQIAKAGSNEAPA